ncbi:MAG: hypothetical protein Q9190_003163 [Brigantiaea leucoxantha]
MSAAASRIAAKVGTSATKVAQASRPSPGPKAEASALQKRAKRDPELYSATLSINELIRATDPSDGNDRRLWDGWVSFWYYSQTLTKEAVNQADSETPHRHQTHIILI